jgi:hypothetical protein
VLEQFPERPADAHELELHLRGDPRAAAMDALVRIAKWHFPAPQMVPVHGVLAEFRVPWIETEGALAAFLGITPSELDWFADARRYNTARSDTALRHYHYRWVKKRTSGYRLFETPKPRLNFQQGMRASRRVRHAPTLLHNAAKFGPESQNREGHSDFQAHLSGRIAWVAPTSPKTSEWLGQRPRVLTVRRTR